MRIMIFFLCLSYSLLGIDFVLFTQPKTGTHLLIPILEELTHKRIYWAPEFTNQFNRDTDTLWNPTDLNHFPFSVNKTPWSHLTMEQVWKETNKQKAFLHLHAPYSLAMETYLAQKKCINFFVKRDPRDQVVSLLNHYKYISSDHPQLNELSSDDEKLLHLIQHELRKNFISFQGWLQSSQCCVLDFHRLMGSHGGGATEREALLELKKITQTLSIQITDAHLLVLYKKHFGKGWNFFRGKVGSWRDYFKQEHKAAAKQAIGDLLIELGYESNDQW